MDGRIVGWRQEDTDRQYYTFNFKLAKCLFATSGSSFNSITVTAGSTSSPQSYFKNDQSSVTFSHECPGDTISTTLTNVSLGT